MFKGLISQGPIVQGQIVQGQIVWGRIVEGQQPTCTQILLYPFLYVKLFFPTVNK
jgi:hypothetical protein